MAIFASLSDMYDRYNAVDLEQLTDGDGGVDEQRVERLLESADNLIKSHVSAHYDTGAFASVPPLLTDIACTIAYYRLFSNAVPDQVKDDYKDAIRTLERIADGKVKLDEGSKPAAPRAGAIHVSGNPRLFTRDRMDGM